MAQMRDAGPGPTSTVFGADTPSRGHNDPHDLAHALRRAWYLVVRGLDSGPALAGLHDHQVWLLSSLSHGPRRMGELALVTGTTQANITGMVARLEERGLAVRGSDPADRRAVVVALTDEGRAALAESRAAFDARLDAVFADLRAEERAALASLLRRAVHP